MKSSFNKYRRIEITLARLRRGHTILTKSYLMEGGTQTDPAGCDRSSICITVKHILVEWPKIYDGTESTGTKVTLV